MGEMIPQVPRVGHPAQAPADERVIGLDIHSVQRVRGEQLNGHATRKSAFVHVESPNRSRIDCRRERISPLVDLFPVIAWRLRDIQTAMRLTGRYSFYAAIATPRDHSTKAHSERE